MPTVIYDGSAEEFIEGLQLAGVEIDEFSVDTNDTIHISALNMGNLSVNRGAIITTPPSSTLQKDKVLSGGKWKVKKSESLAETYIKYVDDVSNGNKTFNDFFDDIGISEKHRTDFAVASILKEAREIIEKENSNA